ncbi:MAG: TlpA family protein disulfide reductase [Hyphomicrobiales bacterium]|nr:TlpA family protein disulfide reductase [Hyphomicrobiales bacterium]
MNDETAGKSRLGRTIFLTALAGAVAGLVAVYVIGGREGNDAAQAACAGAVERAAELAPLATGEIAGFQVVETPANVSDLAFTDADGKARTLAEWNGRTVLLNLWATWCAPCRREMPALDRLQTALGSADFEVAAVNIDTRGKEKPNRFLDEISVAALARYFDDSAGIFKTLRSRGLAYGMPTTLLVDRSGCVLGHLAGAAEWDSDDAQALIRKAL